MIGKENKIIRIARLAYSLFFGVLWYYSPFNRFKKMRFYSDEDVIKKFNKGYSIARAGDGELRIINEIPSDFFQKNDKELARRLSFTLRTNTKKLIVCLPKTLKTVKGLKIKAKLFWISNIFWNRKAWGGLISLEKIYGDALITRPYIDVKKKENAKKHFEMIKKAWDGKDVCIIEGEKTKLGEGNDLFSTAKSIKRIIAPAKDAYTEYDSILRKALKMDKRYIFLVALGPTATVLCSDLANNDRIAFDVGHIDVEYEWMIRKAKKKIPIEGKDVNEANKRKGIIRSCISKIRLGDIMSPIVFITLFIPSIIVRFIYRLMDKKIWLISEGGEARDNGYQFFEYMRDNHPDVFCLFAINKKSPSYNTVRGSRHIVKWGSLKHWFYYMIADLNISSQIGGNPCTRFWYIMHVVLGLYNNRVFLQHGITKDNAKWLHYDRTRFKKFICGAKNEYEYIDKFFGYPKENVVLTGFARWDNLYDRKKDKTILVMPTWREQLKAGNNRKVDLNSFLKSDYYKYWNGLLTDKAFIDYIEKNDITVYFYPHENMQSVLDRFDKKSNNIKFVSLEGDIQKYLSECSLMITDYSSVAFDFAYLSKPVIYYQFDYSEYRKYQYDEGYYNYNNDGFGPVVKTVKEAVDAITNKKYLSNVYKDRMNNFFGDNLFSKGNCRRIYYSLMNIPEENGYCDKKVSIIVPSYNGARYVERCIKSIINQSYTNIEVLLIDDGSTDNTLKIMKHYSKIDSRVTVISKKNEGPNKARLAGLQRATGEYVMFVDSDDWIYEESVNELLRCSLKNNVDVVKFAAKMEPSGRVFGDLKNADAGDIIVDKNYIKRMLYSTNSFNNLWLHFFDARILENIKAFNTDMIYGEDYLANMEILNKVDNMYITNKCYYSYYFNSTSNTRSSDINIIRNNLKDLELVYLKIINELEKTDFTEEEKSQIVFSLLERTANKIFTLFRAKNLKYEDFEAILNGLYKSKLFVYIKGKIQKKDVSKYVHAMPVLKRIKKGRVIILAYGGKIRSLWKYRIPYIIKEKIKNIRGRND